MKRSTLPRIVAALGVTTLAVLLPAAAAGAHVRVIPEDTESGAFTKVTFRVPNEQDAASTTKLTVTVPAATPLPYVSAQQLDGWKVTTTTADLPTPVDLEGTKITKAVSTITWTADRDHAIPPGGFQEFAISGGPLPSGKEMTFTAVQTYSNGDVVKWDQPTPAGGEEPEYPAPSFALTAPSTAGSAGSAGMSGMSGSVVATAAADHDATARWLGGAGLALGVVALAVAVAGARRRPAAAVPAVRTSEPGQVNA